MSLNEFELFVMMAWVHGLCSGLWVAFFPALETQWRSRKDAP